MTHPVLQAIADRRSIRAYGPAPLTRAQEQALLNAALQAPSARNAQPWHFTLVTDQALLDRINASACRVLAQGDEAQRARFSDTAYHMFFHAPAVIFLSADPEYHWSGIDCGIAVENIALAAQGLGLGSVILGLPRAAFQGEDAAEFARLLEFPEGAAFQIAIAVGVPATAKDAHPIGENKVSIVR